MDFMKNNKRRAAAILTAAALCISFAVGCTRETPPSDDPTSFGSGGISIPLPKEDLTVIIDPGHGFRDPGSQPSNFENPEKDVTLKAALMLRDALEAKGVKTVLTHDGETYPAEKTIIEKADEYKLSYKCDENSTDSTRITEDGIFSAYERMVWTQILEREYPDAFFISLHTNALDETQKGAADVSGASIDWCRDNKSRNDCAYFAEKLGEIMPTELAMALKISEDEYADSFLVTKNVSIPAVLIELGYGSNKGDAEKIQSDVWLSDFAGKVTSILIDTYKTSASE